MNYQKIYWVLFGKVNLEDKNKNGLLLDLLEKKRNKFKNKKSRIY